MAKENNNTKNKIKKALERVRPALQADGGDVMFIDWNEKTGVVQVRLMGMCVGCPMSQITLTEGVEKEIKRTVPEVKAVEQV